MNIKFTTEHEVKFSIEEFISEEGGMIHDTFGEPVDTIEEAINLLKVARSSSKNNEWIIVCHVETCIEKVTK